MENSHNEVTTPKVKKKHSLKQIVGIVFIFVSIIVVAIVVYSTLEDEMPASWGEFFDALPAFFKSYNLLWAVGCLLLVMFLTSLNFYLLIKSHNGRRYPKDSLRLHVVGRYYDYITPYSSGGEPYQIYHMRKIHLSTGQAASITFMNFSASRMAFLVLSVVFFIAVRDVQMEDWVRVIAYIGAFTSTALPVILMSLTLSKKISRWMLKVTYAIINKFPFKKKEEKKITITRYIRNYHTSVRDLSGNIPLLLILFFNSIIIHFSLAAIPYFVIKALPEIYLQPNPNQVLNLSNIVTLSLYTTCFTNVWPTPGGAGGAELSFKAIFSTYVTGSHLTWAIFIWRFITYYFYIVVGLILVVISAAQVKKQKKMPKVTTPKLNTYQFVDNYYPVVDGVVKVVDNYARYLNAEGYHTKVVVPNYRDADDSKLTYEVIRLPSVQFRFSQYAVAKPRMKRKTKKLFNEAHPAIFHAHSPFLVGHRAIKLAQRYDVPLVGTFHTQYKYDFYQYTKSKLLTKIMLHYVVRFYKACDEVWAVSRFAADVLRSYGFNKPIKVMENGIEFDVVENIEQYQPAIREEYGINPKEKNLLFVGQLIWQKNIKMVLDTYAALYAIDPSYRLIMAGGAGNEKAVHEYAKKIGIYDEIIWTGEISDRQKMQVVYSLSDLFFFPSLYETFSIVLRESAVMGLPALVAAGGVTEEAITDGHSGYVAKNDVNEMVNKIQEIFADPNKMKEVGHNAKVEIPVAWSVLVKDVATEYERIIKNYYVEFETKTEEVK